MFWTRLGTCRSITSFPVFLLFSSFLFCFSFLLLMVFPFWFSISLTSNSFLSFFSHYSFFYINHAIVTPLHPFGLLVSKKDYIYRCSRYANNPYTLVAFCFLFSFSSLSPFFSVPLLFYHLSSLFLSSCSSSHLDYRLPFCYARLVFPSLHFFSFFSLFLFSFLFFADINRL